MKVPPPSPFVRTLLRLAYPPIGVGLTALAVVVIPLSLLTWPVDRRLRLPRVLVFALTFMWEDIGLVVGCWWLWLRALVRGRGDWWEQHEALAVAALDHVMRAARRWIGLEVALDGELDWGDDGEALVVLARHAGPADSIALASLLTSRARRVPRVVLAAGLLWDPGMSFVLQRLSSYFVPSRSGAGDDRSDGVRRLAASLGPRDALLIFPEGRNWTPRRHGALLQDLRAKGEDAAAERVAARPYVLPPRPRGVQAILATQPSCDVMIAAHTGLELLASPRAIWQAIPFTSRLLVNARTWEHAELPGDEEGVAAWLDEQWGVVDAWVASHQVVETIL